MSYQQPSVTQGAAEAAEQARLLAGNARYLIATAARAPSIHNSQPWRFRVDADAVELWADPARKTRDDAIGREMLISCGAALFGLRLAVRSLGYLPVVDLLPDPAQLRLLARVRVATGARGIALNELERRMLLAVPHRHTHRGPFLAEPLPSGLLAGLQNDALTEGATLVLVGDGLPADRLARLAAAARRADLDPGERAGIRRWTRGPRHPAPDGVPATALVQGPSEAEPGRLPQRDFDLGRDLGLLPGGGAPSGGDRGPADGRRPPRRLAACRAGAAARAAARRERVGVRQPVHPAAGGPAHPRADPRPAETARRPADAAAVRPRGHRGEHPAPPARRGHGPVRGTTPPGARPRRRRRGRR